jgi:hypothetical protein
MTRLGPGLLLLAIGAYAEGALTSWWAIGGLPVALAGIYLIVSADRHAEDVIFRETAADGRKLIVASTCRQAEIAAGKLGLARHEWQYVHFVGHIRGARIDEVVVATPVGSRSRRFAEIAAEVIHIAARDGHEPQIVKTW